MTTKQQVVLDFFGNEIEVGDEVAYIETGYRNFLIGIVDGFTPKQVKIKKQKERRRKISLLTFDF